MRIISMTATFGKLEHQTLTLKPGLNIIEAPNEWGKSTWCAFLVAMLYGIDTRSHTTKNALADKERYAPWSGSPMSGSMDVSWNGRNITIQRSTKGRIPMGEFAAFETESGIPVSELTAENCGQKLLGVERTVFTRSGFIKLTDLPVTQDETLLHRLNALVTTGDDSGAAENLERQLKELKNRCRYNRTGLIPQAEEERNQLAERLDNFTGLKQQFDGLRKHHKKTLDRIKELENHRAALQFHDAQADAQRVAAAVAERDDAFREMESLKALCAELPTREEASQAMERLQELRDEHTKLEQKIKALPDEEHPVFGDIPAEEAVDMARKDIDTYIRSGVVNPLLWILCLLAVAVGAVMLVMQQALWYIGAIVLACGIGLAVMNIILLKMGRTRRKVLTERYGAPPESWIPMAREYAQNHVGGRNDLYSRMDALLMDIDTLCEGESLTGLIDQCAEIIGKHEAYDSAQKAYQRAAGHAETVQAMATPVTVPEFGDTLRFTEEETAALLAEAMDELRQTQLKMGQTKGQMDALGSEEDLRAKLAAVRQRLAKLEDTYAAVSIALEALQEAKIELQRRFAPRLAKRAQVLFAAMTGNRYDKLTLDQDLSLQAGAENEDILRSALWRSDGTADQLYLALRLAVSAELTPGAPLVLDDALVRFDDVRLKAAVNILKDEGRRKQVILFTCQSREANI